MLYFLSWKDTIQHDGPMTSPSVVIQALETLVRGRSCARNLTHQATCRTDHLSVAHQRTAHQDLCEADLSSL